MKFRKILKRILAVVVVGFALLQIIQPARTNPPVTNDFLQAAAAPPEVARLFHAACYDCHSNQTRWPWYSYVAPMSWQIAQDVNHGRPHVNLSEWPTNNVELARKKIENMSDEIDDGDMPLKKYTLIHKDARLTSDQRDTLTQWLDAQAKALKAGAN
jgi:Haem-binding domain